MKTLSRPRMSDGIVLTTRVWERELINEENKKSNQYFYWIKFAIPAHTESKDSVLSK